MIGDSEIADFVGFALLLDRFDYPRSFHWYSDIRFMPLGRESSPLFTNGTGNVGDAETINFKRFAPIS